MLLKCPRKEGILFGNEPCRLDAEYRRRARKKGEAKTKEEKKRKTTSGGGSGRREREREKKVGGWVANSFTNIHTPGYVCVYTSLKKSPARGELVGGAPQRL
jgi:hypothetical protein